MSLMVVPIWTCDKVKSATKDWGDSLPDNVLLFKVSELAWPGEISLLCQPWGGKSRKTSEFEVSLVYIVRSRSARDK